MLPATRQSSGISVRPDLGENVTLSLEAGPGRRAVMRSTPLVTTKRLSYFWGRTGNPANPAAGQPLSGSECPRQVGGRSKLLCVRGKDLDIRRWEE